MHLSTFGVRGYTREGAPAKVRFRGCLQHVGQRPPADLDRPPADVGSRLADAEPGPWGATVVPTAQGAVKEKAPVRGTGGHRERRRNAQGMRCMVTLGGLKVTPRRLMVTAGAVCVGGGGGGECVGVCSDGARV